MQYRKDINVTQLTVDEICEAAYPARRVCHTPNREWIAKIAAGHPGSQTDVCLTQTVTVDGMTFEIHGNADLVWEEDSQLFCAEVRSSAVQKVSEAALAAVRFVGWMCAVRAGKTDVTILIARRAADGAGWEVHRENAGLDFLASFAKNLLTACLSDAEFLRYQATNERVTLSHLKFPYPAMREGQEALIRECYRDLRHGKRLYVQAPTGIGKTLSALYPAIRVLGHGDADRIFYLTAKASTRREAMKAAGQLSHIGGKLRAIVLTAKEQACAERERPEYRQRSHHCHTDECAYVKGYASRAGAAVRELLAKTNLFDEDLIWETARVHRVCPYELSLDLSEYCDVIICDYNYVFDPVVRLQRYFGPADKRSHVGGGRHLVLVDEAHNLGDRAREMYSAELSLERIWAVMALAGGEDAFDGALHSLPTAFAELRSLCADTVEKTEDGGEFGYYVTHGTLDAFNQIVLQCADTMNTWKKDHRTHLLVDTAEDVSAELNRFSAVLDEYDKQYLTYVELQGRNVRVRLVCLDPAARLSRVLDQTKASVMFSATLTPTSYFADILGGGPDAVTMSVASPFPRENLLLATVNGVSTRLEDREKTCRRIASCIAAAVSAKYGNYMVYFPSYKYLEDVLSFFEKKYPGVETIVQERNMTRQDREAFLASFKVNHQSVRVGFCVLGGSFSEGVDLPGDRLIGVIVIGVGLPGLSAERNILQEYYAEKNESGYEYAYTYPGMNRVLQAAGRVIRSSDDRGIVVLVDDRYATPQYQTLFPEHWSSPVAVSDPLELQDAVKAFWQAQNR